MATRAESNVVYGAGLVQGVALVTFPAASTIFTSPAYYGFSNTMYGAMFLPQVALAIVASIAGAGLAGRYGLRRLYLAGIAADLASMILLLLSLAFMSERAAAYAVVLTATACLGAGFGLTVPTLNTLTAAFHPERADRSVLTLNALLGLGTVLAPVFVAIFVGLGFWWGLPVLVAVCLVGLLFVSASMPLRTEAAAPTRAGTSSGIPARFWLFASFALLYGFCETMNGNWSQLDMTTNVGASVTVASLALTAFWGMVTVGRVLFAAIERSFPVERTYRVLPFVLALAFVLIWRLPSGSSGFGLFAFGLAGLGCSALLPLTISFGQQQLVSFSAAVAGGVIAVYQVGYGVAALGAGRLQDAGIGLQDIYGASAIVALAMAAVSFLVTKRHIVTSPA
jgi:MFS family permease